MNHRSGRPYRSPVIIEEEKAWVSFYRRVGEVSIATEVIELLKADAYMKRTHLALYLRCSETVRIARERPARARRIGSFVRAMWAGVVYGPACALRKITRESAEGATKCLKTLSTHLTNSTKSSIRYSWVLIDVLEPVGKLWR